MREAEENGTFLLNESMRCCGASVHPMRGHLFYQVLHNGTFVLTWFTLWRERASEGHERCCYRVLRLLPLGPRSSTFVLTWFISSGANAVAMEYLACCRTDFAVARL